MKIPLSWLKEYVDINVPVEELAHRLTMAGVEVSDITTTGGWDNCYVGHVLKVERHPNADRLTVCTVDIGSERLEAVCGAPNVAPGQKVAFARPGARLFSPRTGEMETLKRARIRGVNSNGMICSEIELVLGQDQTGIIVLPEDAPVGTPLSDYLGDHILELEVTPNRPDCLSLLGVAHEVAALTGATLREPPISYQEQGNPINELASVEIADPKLCYRYTASLVTGVKVGPSPQWLQDRLTRAGMRPINNVVDITNYVMLELGQPLHGFDFHTLKQGQIIVRQARKGETLLTLDGEERQLSQPMLVIADAQDAVAVAGVIGGAHTEITEDTTEVLLESANFDPANTRRTAAALKIRSEASIRFEKGLRPELAEIGLRRATRLIQEIAGGTVAQGIADVYPSKEKGTPTLALTTKRLRQVLGVGFPLERVQQVLTSLGFSSQRQDRAALQVTAPYWRSDISIEDDLIEEVARIVGYDEIPTTPLSTPIPHHQPQPLRELRERVRDTLVACGMQEVITYPLVSIEDLNRPGALQDVSQPLRVANPMSREQEYLRLALLPSLLGTLAANRRHYDGPVRIFEVGRVYLPRDGDLPQERETAAGLVAGPRSPLSWLGESSHLDLYDAKGIVDATFSVLGVTPAFQQTEDAFLHPSRAVRILVNNVPVGLSGEVNTSILDALDVKDRPVSVFSLDIEKLLEMLPQEGRRFQPIIRFPSAIRDVSLLLDWTIPSVLVQDIILRHKMVTRVVLLDVYTGEKIPQGKRSLAYRIYFQSPERTLAAEEVNKALQQVVDSLEQELGATLRSS